MEGFLSALIVAIITVIAQWRIAKKESNIRENERRDKFKLASLDKRLEVHQEAYYRWSKMIHLRFRPDVDNFLQGSLDWHYKNCLYLDSKSRVEFIRCINNVLDYKANWQMWRDADKNEKEEYSNQLKLNFNQIINTGDFLAKGVDLKYETTDEIKKSIKFDKD